MTWQTFYNLFLHPLASYPGPKLAAAGRLWYAYHQLKGDMPFAVHELHETYGEVVRVAPDELTYINPDGWNQIYGHRPGKPELKKDQVFYAASGTGEGSIIRADRDRHGYMRKQMSHGFSERAMRDQEGAIREFADMFIARLRQNSAEAQDLVKWFNVRSFGYKMRLSLWLIIDSSSRSTSWVILFLESLSVAWMGLDIILGSGSFSTPSKSDLG